MMYWGYGGGWWMVMGMIFMIIFWAAVIWFVVWGVRRWGRHVSDNGGTTPLEIAKTRYAKGEITREQFEEIKKNL
jgi:putative membrane protein